MTKTVSDLEHLFAKVRLLPPERQELAALALAEIVEDGLYVLSDEERLVLEPELEAAKRGEFASDQEVADILDKPWS